MKLQKRNRISLVLRHIFNFSQTNLIMVVGLSTKPNMKKGAFTLLHIESVTTYLFFAVSFADTAGYIELHWVCVLCIFL